MSEDQPSNFTDRVAGKSDANERVQVRSGDVIATIFPNKTNDGKTFDSVTLQKKYPGPDGKDAYGNSFDRRDMLDLQRVASKTLDRLEERGKERYQAQAR